MAACAIIDFLGLVGGRDQAWNRCVWDRQFILLQGVDVTALFKDGSQKGIIVKQWKVEIRQGWIPFVKKAQYYDCIQ